MDLMWAILENINLAEAEFWELIGSVTEKEVDSIPNMDIDDLKEVLGVITTKILSYFKKPTS